MRGYIYLIILVTMAYGSAALEHLNKLAVTLNILDVKKDSPTQDGYDLLSNKYEDHIKNVNGADYSKQSYYRRGHRYGSGYTGTFGNVKRAHPRYSANNSGSSKTERLSDADFELNYDMMIKLSHLSQQCIFTEYPNKLYQTLSGKEDLQPPSELHPLFYGCIDWHRSLEGHWVLSRALSLFPGTELADNVTRILTRQLTGTEDLVKRELAYFFRKSDGKKFERNFGWAFLLKFQEELLKTKWQSSLIKLANHMSKSFKEWLPRLLYPIRSGRNENNAFGMSLALDYARTAEDHDLQQLIHNITMKFYRKDRNCPLEWEPSGHDFLSPCLQEAKLMSRVMEDDKQFISWLKDFLPQLFDPDFTLEPASISEEPKWICCGRLLNIARAWCLYSLAARVGGYTGDRWVLMGDKNLQSTGWQKPQVQWIEIYTIWSLEKRKEAVDVLQNKIQK